jgi:transposase
MVDEAATLPEDPERLREMVRALFAERDLAYEALKLKTLEVEKLKMQLARLRRRQFGQSSEKLAHEIAQLELAIEEIEAGEGAAAPATVADTPKTGGETDETTATSTTVLAERRKPARRRLPDHLPRETVVHAPAAACPHCGGTVHALGEDRSEVLEYVPGHVPGLRSDRSGADTDAADRARAARARPARPCPHRQVLRSPAALPAGRYLCP